MERESLTSKTTAIIKMVMCRVHNGLSIRLAQYIDGEHSIYAPKNHFETTI